VIRINCYKLLRKLNFKVIEMALFLISEAYTGNCVTRKGEML